MSGFLVTLSLLGMASADRSSGRIYAREGEQEDNKYYKNKMQKENNRCDEPTVIGLNFNSRFYTGAPLDEGGTEIVAHDETQQLIFSINGFTNEVDVLDFSSGALNSGSKVASLAVGGNPTHIVTHKGMMAVCVGDANDETRRGWVLFYNTANLSAPIAKVWVGALPDMITFTPDGKFVLTADEGQPMDDYSFDPQGSISIISTKDFSVRTASFEKFDGSEDALRSQGIRIFGPGSSASEDFEPEYIAISEDSKTAYVVLQENNAFATVDIESASVVDVTPMGYKNWGLAALGFDANNKDLQIHIESHPNVFGMMQPDGVTLFTIKGKEYLLTGNEGDSRDYGGYSEEVSVKDVMDALDPSAFPPDSDAVAAIANLKMTNTMGDWDNDGLFEEIYAYGARSFSIWDAKTLGLVYDSGRALEDMVAAQFPAFFNSNHKTDSLDNRSDDKGPEPEGVAIGVVGCSTYAFVGLERMSGVVVILLDDPSAPEIVQYINTRTFDETPFSEQDLGPEGIRFISAKDSPVGTPLVIVGNEVSGTVAVYDVVLD